MRILRVVVLPLMFSACAMAQSAPQVQGFQLAPVTPQAGLGGRSLPAIGAAQSNLPSTINLLKTPQDNAVCYAIRSYAFARDNANSDATRLTGSSTCRPSSQLKLKSAVQLKVVR